MKRTFRLRKKSYLPHQWNFLTTDVRESALVSGYGGGKTFVFLRRAFRHLINERTFDTKLSNGWVIYPTYDLGMELFFHPFCALLDRMKLRYKPSLTSHRITVYGFGSVTIKSMQRADRLVGEELTFAGIDEFDVERPSVCDFVWKRLLGRLRGCDNAPIFIVTTPEGFKTTYRLFVEEYRPGRLLVRSKTTDNPFLPANYIESLYANYDAKLVEQYVHGQFVNLIGEQAYYAFDREKNVQDDCEIPGGEIHVGMDFNVNPMTAVVLKRAGQTWHVVREYWLMNSNTWRMCEVIAGDYPRTKVIVHPDMTGIHRSTSAHIGVTDIQILQKEGFIVQGNRPLVKDRLNIVNNLLDKRRVMVHRKCVHLINDLEKVVRDENGEIDKSDKMLTHVSDALGYALNVLCPLASARWGR